MLVALMSFIHLSCTSKPALTILPESEIIQWPQPPEEPRIQFITTISSASDLGIGTGFFSRLLGKKSQQFLRRPVTVAVNSSGRIYVADLSGALHFFDLDSRRTRHQENAIAGPLISPVSIANGPGDSLYVVDSAHKKVFVYTPDLKPVRIFAEYFDRPAGIVWDGEQNRFYVADAGANEIKIFTADGRQIRTFGPVDEDLQNFNTPTQLWMHDGDLYVTDAFNFKVKKLTTEGEVLGSIGTLGNATGSFARPKGVAVDRSGHVYVVDALFGNVQIFDQEGQLLLFFGTTGELDPGSFCLPNGIFIDHQDRIYVADTYHGRIQIFQYLETSGGTP
jgi:sugar lactone lactonase YvrE